MAEDRNLILAFESSCDETSMSIIKNGREEIATVVLSQIDIHKNYGGVVPEIASRNHIENITIVLDEILNNRPISIKRNMKDPIVVSKSTNLASCLEILEAARAHMAVVTDKENKFLGIITMEDIIAELMKS